MVRVLLVDDSEALLSSLSSFLDGEPELEVVGTATGGQEGLLMAGALAPDVIVLDLAMPDLPGLDAIPIIRTSLPDVAITILTVHDPEPYRELALKWGADEFVSKTALGTDLVPAIRRTARDRRALRKARGM